MSSPASCWAFATSTRASIATVKCVYRWRDERKAFRDSSRPTKRSCQQAKRHVNGFPNQGRDFVGCPATMTADSYRLFVPLQYCWQRIVQAIVSRPLPQRYTALDRYRLHYSSSSTHHRSKSHDYTASLGVYTSLKKPGSHSTRRTCRTPSRGRNVSGRGFRAKGLWIARIWCCPR